MTAPADSSFVQETLSVPKEFWYQFVYRQKRAQPIRDEEAPGYAYHFVRRVGQLAPLAGALRRYFGPIGFLKLAAKVLSGKRAFYCMVKDGQVGSYGWATTSFCRAYWMAPGDIVIGPCFTDSAHRGKRLASISMKKAINSLMAEGARVFYIDTSNDNVAAQKMIAKCEFGPPVALYIRGYPRTRAS